MDLEKFELCQCQNEACNQEFNQSNINLAVCLYGVFFLVRSDKGYVGFTCPKCLEINMFQRSYQEVLVFRERLTSMAYFSIYKEDEKGDYLFESELVFEPKLKYYSPFKLDKNICRDFNILWYNFGNPETNDNISGEIEQYRQNEFPELNEYFCSYIDDSDLPARIFTSLYWYREDQIDNLIKYEQENNVRIFPRYHYYTDLHSQIDSLLRFNYFMGVPFDKAKEDHKTKTEATLKVLEKYAFENDMNFEKLRQMNYINDPEIFIDMIEENQKRLTSDPTVPGEFLAVLTSMANPFTGILVGAECPRLCNSVNPFYQKNFPSGFEEHVSYDDPELQAASDKTEKMKSLVLEHSYKQYVQEFLRENLVDFLEKYETIARSRLFSYAPIWTLNQSYLEKLYQATNKGLRSESPYAMYREGESWKIVFNGKAVGGLRGKGFHWIYHIISNPNKKVFYRALHQQFKDDQKQEGEAAWDDQLSVSDSDVLSNRDQEELKTRVRAYDMLIREREEARSKGDTVKLERKTREIAAFIKFLDEQKEKYELKNGDKELHFPALDFTVSDYKKINDRFKKNYRDALSILNKTKGAKELWAHLSDNIQKDEGAFIYRPTEDITWHLD